MKASVKPPEDSVKADLLSNSKNFAVRWSQPLSRRFDNPFFALEMQLMSRHTKTTEGVEGALLSAVFLLGAFTLFPIIDKFTNQTYDAAFGNVMSMIVSGAQTVLCGVLVSWASNRIYQREHVSNTLLDTFLLPIEPLKWICLKSALAWYLLALSWLLGLPLQALLLLTGSAAGIVVFKALLFPLWMGLVIWAYSLILMPDYLHDPPRPAPQGETSRPPWQRKSFALRAADVGRFTLAYVFGFASFFGWMKWVLSTPNDVNPFLGLRYFYNAIAPAGLFWITLNIGFFASALAHGVAMLSPEYQARRRAAAVCWCALASTYYTGLGFFWPLQTDYKHWAALIAPPFVVVVFSRLSEKWVPAPSLDDDAATKPKRPLWRSLPDDWSRREIKSLARAYDNPVFVKDLRVHLRGSSLFAQLFWSVLWSGIALSIINRMGIRGGNWWIWLASYFAYPAARCVMMWQQEARGVTLTMMLLSPLSSREMVQGRFWAGLITGFVWPVMGLAILLWIYFRFNISSRFAFGPALFAVAFVPLVALAVDAASVPGEDMEKTQVQHNGNGGCMAQALLLPCALIALFCGDLPVWLQWVLALVLVVIYCGLAQMFFDEGIKKLDKRRLITKPRKPVYRRY